MSYIILLYSILLYFNLLYSTLFYIILLYSILFYFIVLYSILLHFTSLYSPLLLFTPVFLFVFFTPVYSSSLSFTLLYLSSIFYFTLLQCGVYHSVPSRTSRTILEKNILISYIGISMPFMLNNFEKYHVKLTNNHNTFTSCHSVHVDIFLQDVAQTLYTIFCTFILQHVSIHSFILWHYDLWQKHKEKVSSGIFLSKGKFIFIFERKSSVKIYHARV